LLREFHRLFGHPKMADRRHNDIAGIVSEDETDYMIVRYASRHRPTAGWLSENDFNRQARGKDALTANDGVSP
jgi:hypothetical protein